MIGKWSLLCSWPLKFSIKDWARKMYTFTKGHVAKEFIFLPFFLTRLTCNKLVPVPGIAMPYRKVIGDKFFHNRFLVKRWTACQFFIKWWVFIVQVHDVDNYLEVWGYLEWNVASKLKGPIRFWRLILASNNHPHHGHSFAKTTKPIMSVTMYRV